MTPTNAPPFLTLHWQFPWSGRACSLLARSHGVQGSTCPTQSSSRQMRTMPHAGRKWLLKCRLRDYGAIKVTAGCGESEQLPRKQADVSVQNTPTASIDMEAARSGSSFPRGQTAGQPIWEASLLLLWSLLCREGEAGSRRERSCAVLHCSWPSVLSYNKGSLFPVLIIIFFKGTIFSCYCAWINSIPNDITVLRKSFSFFFSF